MGDMMEFTYKNQLSFVKTSKKMCIFGCPGSGKSTLSKNLSTILDLDVYHLDNIYWKPNWVNISKEEFDSRLNELLSLEKYIIEGNYNRTLDLRLEKCDCAIYLDFNRFTCLFSVIKRYFMYKNKTRDDLTVGCDEALDKEFISYVWHFNKKFRKKYYFKLGNLNKKVIVLKNRRQVKKFLKELQK